MFDVGFSELLLCLIIALIVLGPERLPGLMRTVGRWTGQARAYMRHLGEELERETRASEIRQQLEEARTHLHNAANTAGTEAQKLIDKTVKRD